MTKGGMGPGLRGLIAIGIVLAGAPASAAPPQEEHVIREACGEDPEPGCVAELRKVCHRKMTMRCYLSRKARIDAKRDGAEPETPERADERDDRAIFYDE